MGVTHHGAFRLAVQHGQRGYHGEIEIEIDVLEDGKELDISIPDRWREWQHAIGFGIAYARDKSATLSKKVMRVRVTDVIWHNRADTTLTVMAFVAAHAVWNALNETPASPPTLNAREGSVVFPT
jgi:hypothetical protein